MKEEYEKNLREFGERLKNVADVKVNLSGKGSFIFAQSEDKSIELSESEDEVWVEFFNGEGNEPDHESTYPNYEESFFPIISWFTSD